MKMSVEVLEVMGESADGSISPYVWGPALINAAQQIKALDADKAALMEVVRGAVHRFDDGSRAMQKALDALPAHLKEEASK